VPELSAYWLGMTIVVLMRHRVPGQHAGDGRAVVAPAVFASAWVAFGYLAWGR